MAASSEAGEADRATGAERPRVRRLQIGLIGLGSGATLAFALGFVVPGLVALDEHRSATVRLFALAIGAVVGLTVVLLGPSQEPPGTRLATRIGSLIAITGMSISVLLGGVALVAPLGFAFDRSSIAALTAGGVGMSLVVSMLASVVASTGARGTSSPSIGVPLRMMIGGSTAALTLSTWALATAYLIGHLQATGRQSSVAEARDLVAILESVPPAELARHLADLKPPGGFIGRLGPDGQNAADGGGLPIGAHVEIAEGWTTICRLSAQDAPLPCATRAQPDGARLVAAVPAVPIPLQLLIIFVLVGAGATVVAIAIGTTLARGPADDLDRVAAVLDELGRAMQGGLDRPIPAVSLDEVGDLAVALARLRVRLRPGLVEHDEALARAHAADGERDQFLSLVSEELRAPLDRVLASARATLDGEDPLTPSQREDIRLIVSSSTHLIELIEEVLDLSAIATGQIRLRLGEVDLSAVASDVALAQRPLLGSRKVELKLQLLPEPVRLIGDERRLRQVITNLVSNAVKFTAEGSVTVSIQREADAHVLSVSDTGPGIAAEQLPKLFTEFVQLGSLRQRARGTGLGLAICKRLIDAHQGTITAHSELGIGTTFTVRLPIVSEARA